MAPGEVPPDAIDARGMSSDVFGPDESGCPPANGQLEKRNARGRWQSRYFVANNGFLNYYPDRKKEQCIASIDLSKVLNVNTVDMSGTFVLDFGDGEEYDLRAGDLSAASTWCETLRPRVTWAREAAKQQAQARAAALRGGVDTPDSDGDDEEEDAVQDVLAPLPSGGPASGAAGRGATRSRAMNRRASLLQAHKTLSQRAPEGVALFSRSARHTAPPDPPRSLAERLADEYDGGGAGGGGGGPGITRSPSGRRVAAPPPRRPQRPHGAAALGGGGAGVTSPPSRGGGGAPAPPTLSGWLKKRVPGSRLAAWQKRWLDLTPEGLFIRTGSGSKDFNARLPCHLIRSVAPLSARTVETAFTVTPPPTWGVPFTLKARTPAECSGWVQALTTAAAQAAGAGGGGSGSAHRTSSVGGGGDAYDSDDSDAGRGGGGGGGGRSHLPPWMQAFQQADDGERVLSVETFVQETFQGALQAEGDIGALHEAVMQGAATLDERVTEALRHGRSKIVLMYIVAYDRRLTNQLSTWTSGTALSDVKSDKILQLLDAVQAYSGVRSRAVGGVAVVEDATAAQAAEKGAELAEQARLLSDQYVANLAPELKRIRENTVAQVMAKGLDAVKQDAATLSRTRLKTSMPFDFFQLLEIPLAMARRGGSPALQRQLLSKAMEEVTHLSADVLAGVKRQWSLRPEALEEDYVCALVNDCGSLLDLLEQFEDRFEATIAVERAERKRALASAVLGGAHAQGAAAADGPTEVDDLAGVALDLPRTQKQVMHCAVFLTGVLRDVVMGDLMPHVSKLFGAGWNPEGAAPDPPMQYLLGTLSDFFDDFQAYLHPFFMRILSGQVFQAIITAYVAMLVQASKPRGSLLALGARHFTPAMQAEVRSDVQLLNGGAAQYLGDEDRMVLFKPLFFARDALTAPLDEDPVTGLSFMDVMEQHLVNLSHAGMHWYLTLQALLRLRPDVSDANRPGLLVAARRVFNASAADPGDEAERSMLLLGNAASWSPATAWLCVMCALWPDCGEQYETWLAEAEQWEQEQQEREAAAAAAAATPAKRGFWGGLFGGRGAAESDSSVSPAQAPVTADTGTPALPPDGGIVELSFDQLVPGAVATGGSTGAGGRVRQRSASRSSLAPGALRHAAWGGSDDLPSPGAIDFDGAGDGPMASAPPTPTDSSWATPSPAPSPAPVHTFGGGGGGFSRGAAFGARRRGVDDEDDEW